MLADLYMDIFMNMSMDMGIVMCGACTCVCTERCAWTCAWTCVYACEQAPFAPVGTAAAALVKLVTLQACTHARMHEYTRTHECTYTRTLHRRASRMWCVCSSSLVAALVCAALRACVRALSALSVLSACVRACVRCGAVRRGAVRCGAVRCGAVRSEAVRWRFGGGKAYKGQSGGALG